MDAELKEYLQAMEARMDARPDALEDRMRKHQESVDARLLNNFRKWSAAADMKSRHQTITITGLDERLSYLEERVRDI